MPCPPKKNPTAPSDLRVAKPKEPPVLLDTVKKMVVPEPTPWIDISIEEASPIAPLEKAKAVVPDPAPANPAVTKASAPNLTNATHKFD